MQAAHMRQQGRSWAEIGTAFQLAYRVNPRVALRHAHGWSQPQAAERWTEMWPDDPKTFKNFSYWEQWPGQTGHAPSLDTLDRLARMYECKVTDLLTDCQDYGAKPAPVASLQVKDRGPGDGAAADPVAQAPAEPRAPDTWPSRVLPPPCRRRPCPAGFGYAPGDVAEISTSTLHAALEMIRQAEASELDQAGSDVDEPARRLRRRTLLLEASSALAVVAAAPVLEVPRITGSAQIPARPGRSGDRELHQ